jgi:hypothetical protein
MDVIDSNSLERDFSEKPAPRSTFSHPALECEVAVTALAFHMRDRGAARAGGGV